MTPDSELLTTFARTNSEDAFSELVRRHVNLVYSTALRQVNGDAHLAQDVAQTVFADLVRKAASLSRRESLTGWLYTSAHFAAAKAVRTETRRRDREETFMREPSNEPVPEADWEQIGPVLDDAMHELKDADREAILLRYFENRSFAEVGARLGLNENAARMRVDRALEKLRAIFTKRNIATTAALASAISANAVQIAPASLVGTLTAASLATTGTGTLTLLKIMTATQVKLGISAVIVAGAATGLIMQHRAQARLAAINQTLLRQVGELQNDLSKATNVIVTAVNPSSLSENQFNELLKLRGEVGVLQRQLDLQKSAAATTATGSNALPTPLVAQNHFMSRNQIADAGFDTPEAALQTWMHGILTTNYEAVTNAIMSNLQADVLAKYPNQRDQFEKSLTQGAMTNFLGQEIVAKKVLSDDTVELEVLVFTGGEGPEIAVQRMVREGDGWKFAGSIGLADDWRKNGNFQTVNPPSGQ